MNDAWDLGLTIGSGISFLLMAVALILAVAGVLALRAGDVTEGLLFGLVGFIVLLGELAPIYGYDPLIYANWMLAFLLIVIILVLFISGDVMFGGAVMAFTVGFVVFLIFDTSFVDIVSGFMFLLSGILFLYIAISDWLYVETGIDLPIL
jgi:hypothetical protein